MYKAKCMLITKYLYTKEKLKEIEKSLVALKAFKL